MTSTFCYGKGCVNKIWKKKKQKETLCIVWSFTRASHSISEFYKQLFIERWKVKETWVRKRLIKEWEAGGCERNFMVFVWDKSLSTFLHLALLGYFSGIAEMKAQVGGVHCCAPARWFSSPKAPCGLRTGRGAETWTSFSPGAQHQSCNPSLKWCHEHAQSKD